MGKPQLLTNFTDRIRSGAILTASGRNTPGGSSLNTSQRDFVRAPGSAGRFDTENAQSLSRRATDSSSTENVRQADVNNIDIEKGLHDAKRSAENSDAVSPDTQSPGQTATAVTENNHDDKAKKPKLPFGQRMKRGTRRFWMHTRNAVTHSWLNVLLIFVPIGIAAEAAHLNPAVIFAMNSVAIIPLAGLLTMATESVAGRLGDTWGALLNVSFGNAVELIIFIIGLVKNEIRIVQAALLGSLLANLLLILGMAFVLGGLRYREQIYNSTVTQMSACLLSLSVMSLLLPTAFHASFEDDRVADKATIKMSRGVSVILLCVYGLYLLFQLKSHSYLYQSMPQEQIDEETEPAFLHDMLDPESSSSSSSSSSDSDSDSSSNTTRKRIKRAFTSRKRRKSSAATSMRERGHDSRSVITEHPTLHEPLEEQESKDSDEVPIIVTSPAYSPSQNVKDDAGEKNPSDDSHIPTVRDFQQGAESNSDANSQAVELDPEPARPKLSKHALKQSRRSQRRERRRSRRQRRRNEDDLSDGEIAAARQVGFREVETQDHAQGTEASRPPPTSRLSFFRPGLPKLFSENVFVQPVQTSELQRLPSQQAPATRVALKRARSNVQRDPTTKEMRAGIFPGRNNSSPNLTSTHLSKENMRAISTIPGRGLQPSVLPGPLRKRVTDPAAGNAIDAQDDDEDLENPEMSRVAAVVLLLASTGLVALCAEFLVSAIPAMTENSSVSQAFIGLIILPIVGNAAEHATAVTVAMKNKMDLAIGVALGSSIQIALFITPLVIIIGWILNKAMTLYFTLFETISLFVTAFVVNFLVLDGRSNYLEGTLLMAAYVIIAIAAFYYPDSADASELGGTPRNHTSTDVNHLVQLLF